MIKRGITIAALAIACVFVVTTAVLAACIYSDYNAGLKSAGAKFEKLSSRTAEASGIYPSGSREFLNLFNSAVGSPDIFESIRLEIEGREVYVYPAHSEPQTSAFVKTFSSRLLGGDGADIRLSANIYAVAPALIFYRAKIAFVIILAGTLAAGLLLMYLYLGAAQEEDKDYIQEDGGFKKTKIEDDFGESLFDEGSAEDAASESPETEEAPAAAEEESESAKDEPAANESAENAAAAEAEPESKEDKVDFNPLENAYADQQSEMPESGAGEGAAASAPISSEEQGLFSPASGFGWESYLDARLESELVRAASSEQDLSLAIIKIPSMTKESDYYGNVCQALLDFFQFKDFVFEFKEDGFAAIIQNKDVDQSLQSAEVLHSNLRGVLSKAGQDAIPLIGLSSRSLRLISAERLKNEAEQALVHATDDPASPIIAFRVNPEKYRKFISGQDTEEQKAGEESAAS